MGNLTTKVKVIENSEGLLKEPPDSGSLTVAWVQRQLERGGESVSLSQVDVEQLCAAGVDGEMRQDGGGVSGSRIVRLRLTYAEGGNRLPNGADTLVMKWTSFKRVPPMPINLRVAQVVIFHVNQADLFRTEHYFLTQVKEVHTWGVKTPITYSTAMQDATEPASCLRLVADMRSDLMTSCLMQDIGAYKTPADPFENITRSQARGALRNVARLHRATWGRCKKWTPDLHEIYGRNGFATSHTGLYGLKGSGVYKKKKKFATTKGPEGFCKTWGSGNKRPGNDAGLLAIKEVAGDPNLLTALKDLQRNWASVFPSLGSKDPLCMVHGDFHHWNNMFGESDDDVMLIDWQYFGAGRPMYEVLFFLNAGVNVSTVSEDQDLIRSYHEVLTSPDLPGPVPDVSIDDLMVQYRLALIDCATTMCLSMGTATMGVSYTPKDYLGMAKDPKQKDFVMGGMLLSNRIFKRLMAVHSHYGGFSQVLDHYRQPTTAPAETDLLFSDLATSPSTQ
eukprot:TRINITY_DN18296_c0_g2_i1.p1 TRINITY_DN18296_c0_g2~~TRINITY_DN18296_c0_g2_i1.p1  ORF type:complete len:505 (+),score=159.59 TRINITY_DN18296_c0_g2_i1:163-1677(+)